MTTHEPLNNDGTAPRTEHMPAYYQGLIDHIERASDTPAGTAPLYDATTVHRIIQAIRNGYQRTERIADENARELAELGETLAEVRRERDENYAMYRRERETADYWRDYALADKPRMMTPVWFILREITDIYGGTHHEYVGQDTVKQRAIETAIEIAKQSDGPGIDKARYLVAQLLGHVHVPQAAVDFVAIENIPF